MSTQTQLQIRGLARDPNGFQASSGGALRRAENVVIRSEGVAESRPNFDLLYEKKPTDLRIKSLREFDGAVLTIEQDSVTGEWYLALNGTALTPPDGSLSFPAPPNYDDTESKFAEARGNLYVTGVRGGLVVESGSASAARFAGVDLRVKWNPWSGFVAPVANGLRYAYRLVFVRKDASLYTRRSPPSERYILDGVLAAGSTLYFPPELVAGDQIEFYRSLASATSSTAPRPEHFLAFTYTLTSTNISAGTCSPPADTVADSDLGAELYTDSSQGGAIAAKYRPPMASVLAWWQRCMWFGRTRAASRLLLTLNALFRPNTPVYWSGAAGWSFTSGSPTATAPSATGLFIGMTIADDDNLGAPDVAGAYIPATTTITNIVGTTITMSHNALATGSKSVNGFTQSAAPDGLAAYGIVCSGTIGTVSITTTYTTTVLHVGMYFWVTIGGTPFKTTIASITGANTFNIAANLPGTIAAASVSVGDIITINAALFYVGAPTTTSYNTPALPDITLGRAALGAFMQNLAVSIELYALTHPTWGVNAVLLGDLYKDVGHPTTGRDANGLYTWPGTVGTALLLEEGEGDGASFSQSISVSCTAAHAFTPATPLTSESTVAPNRVYFSDPDEPESVPLVNYFDFGALDEPIQALVPLRDMLLVFKTDGLWRVTGSAPSSWSVESVDTTLRLVRPETVCVVNGIAYAWCDRGFFAVTEGGAQSLSANALDVELRAAAALVMNQPLSHGAFVVGWRRRNLVLLGVPSGTEALACAKVYAFSLTTDGWSEWPVAWGTACESQALDAIYYSRPADTVTNYEVRRASEDGPRGYDRQFSLSGVAYDGLVTITISVVDASEWIPVVGDFIGAAVGSTHQYRRITVVAVAAGVYTLTIEAAISGIGEVPAWRAREGAPIVIEWHPTAAGGVPMGSLMREIHLQLDLRDVDQKTDLSLPEYTVGGTTERGGPYTLTSNKARSATIQPLRVGISRQAARAASLAAYLAVNDIARIRVLGVSLVYERTSERTSR